MCWCLSVLRAGLRGFRILLEIFGGGGQAWGGVVRVWGFPGSWKVLVGVFGEKCRCC